MPSIYVYVRTEYITVEKRRCINDQDLESISHDTMHGISIFYFSVSALQKNDHLADFSSIQRPSTIITTWCLHREPFFFFYFDYPAYPASMYALGSVDVAHVNSIDEAIAKMPSVKPSTSPQFLSMVAFSFVCV